MQQVNKKLVAHSFDKAAQYYEQYAQLQRMSGNALLKLAPANFGPNVLDAGCGTGWYSRYWCKLGCRVTALDLSACMLQVAHKQQSAQYYLQGDIDGLPLIDESFDGIWSNLVLQWSNDPYMALQQFLRVIRPGGIILFSTLLNGSLNEVNLAWKKIDTNRTHINYFLSKKQFNALTERLYFLYHQSQIITLHFPNALSAMRSLKNVGATYLHSGRRNGLLTPIQLAHLDRFWPQDKLGYRLSYHLMYGVLTK